MLGLRDQLLSVEDSYDFVMIDTPPSLGVLTINALVAATKVIIPTEARFFSLQGLQMLEESIDEILYRLRQGDTIALVSDAGMPAVSDPGFRLLRAAVDAGVEVHVVPGPSAVTAALVVSGLPTDRWVFEGFLPRRTGDRSARLASGPRERRPHRGAAGSRHASRHRTAGRARLAPRGGR